MANVYHQSGTIIRQYGYLDALERSIRRELNCEEGEKAFTREGQFYSKKSEWRSRLIGLSFKAVLGSLLLAFFLLRFIRDWPKAYAAWTELNLESFATFEKWSHDHMLLLLPLDIIVLIPTVIMYWNYVRLAPRG